MNRSGPDPLAPADGGDPFVILVSACLLGEPVGYDGSAFPSDPVRALGELPGVRLVPFCPETFALGVPRRWMTMHDGDGFDVLDGTARVVNVDGEDLSEAFLRGAREALARARAEGAQLAILTDISPSCGSTVVYAGEALPERRYRASSGVTTALLRRAGVPVISQRDHASLERLRARLEPGYTPDPEARDHVDGEWYRQTFLEPAPDAPEPMFEEVDEVTTPR